MTKRDVRGKRVTVVGAARSGTAVAGLLHRHGAEVFVTDAGREDPEVRRRIDEIGVRAEFGGHSPLGLEADLVIVSPGVPESNSLVRSVLEHGLPLYSEIECASWFCSASIVAITGSNGKTTTTTLLTHVLQSAGLDAISAGNIGVPFSDVADTVSDEAIVVLETSSFQLDHIAAFRPKVAVLLNITPDHLDRYDNDFSRYSASKLRIFENQKEGDALVYNADDVVVADGVSARLQVGPVRLEFSQAREVERGAFVRGDSIIVNIHNQEEVLMPYEELTLRGRHNLYNTLAASVAARFLEVENEAIRESMRSFQGVRHRLELIRDLDGVRYVNDSKATNVNAVWYALESFADKVVLIAGGIDKGNDYDEIRDLVARRVRALVLIGQAADRIEQELGPIVSTIRRAGSMEDAVRSAARLAHAGDVVLLSPACASFDMFENYEHRGDVFRAAVLGLSSDG